MTQSTVYGFTSLYHIILQDQLPIELATSSDSTIDTKGVSLWYLLHILTKYQPPSHALYDATTGL